MVFDRAGDGEVFSRYRTWAEAEAGHKQAVAGLTARYVKVEETG